MSITETNLPDNDVIWGAEAIALWLNRPVKSVYPALDADRIPGAKKIAGKWALRPKVFLAAFEADAT